MNESEQALIRWNESRGNPEANQLVLILHGMDSSPTTAQGLAELVEKRDPDCHILIPALPFKWQRSFDFRRLAEEVLTYLDQQLDLERYGSIRIIGHSSGGVLAQVVYLLAKTQAGFGLGRVPLDRLRLILLAPITRGWEISHYLPLHTKLAWTLGTVLSPFLTLFHCSLGHRGEDARPWILQLKRGSQLLIWLRLAWLSQTERPEMVQLLGSIDELISWRDMVDREVGDAIAYFEVPHSDHGSIVNLTDPEHGPARSDVLRAALGSMQEVRESCYSIRPWDVDPPEPDPNVKRVVFVIHGIRDEGHWTQKVGSRARRMYAEECDTGDPEAARKEVAVVTGSYGFFSMLQFLLPIERSRKVHWLVDRFVEAKSRYPNAKFSYVGHSNGTYLVAHAMHRYPGIKFERVAFAGSVVSRRFDWDALHLRGQVEAVLNFTASNDWVVGFIPQLADILPRAWTLGTDLGGAGVYSFEKSPVVHFAGHLIGGHGRGIAEDNWDHLVRFVALPQAVLPDSNTEDYTAERSTFLNVGKGGWVACASAWILALLVILVALPTLAWSHPVLLWLFPVLPCALAIVLVAILQRGRSGASFEARRKLQTQSSLVLRVLGGAILLWFVLVVPFLVFSVKIESNVGDTWRTLSVVAYAFLAHRVLTRV